MITNGIDLIEVGRVQRAVEKHGRTFLDRVFTPQEQKACNGRPDRLAGRFAVKEAVAKALGTGIGAVRWVDIEVVTAEDGRPGLALHGAAAEIAAQGGWTHWSISLSHSAEYAVAQAVALRQQSGV